METQKHRRLSVIGLFLLGVALLSACKTGDSASSPADPSTSSPEAPLVLLPDEGLGDPDPQAYAPSLNSRLVYAQVANPDENTAAAVIGLAGATPSVVTEICAQNLSASSATACAAPRTDGSFRLTIAASAGDVLSIWTNAPGFAKGGVNKNDIRKKVQVLAPRFPYGSRAMTRTSAAVFVGTNYGLYALPISELSKSPSEMDTRFYTVGHGLPSNRISALADDGNGGVWIGTLDGGFGHLSRGAGDVEQFEKWSLPNDQNYRGVLAIVPASNGILWVATAHELLQVRFIGGEAKFTTYSSASGLARVTTSILASDGGGGLWAGYTGGLYRLQVVNGAMEATRILSEEILDLAPSTPGSLWVASTTYVTSLTVHSGGASSFTRISQNDSRFNSGSRRDVLGLDSTGSAWLTGQYENQVYRLVAGAESVTVAETQSSLGSVWNAADVVEDGEDGVFVRDSRGLIRLQRSMSNSAWVRYETDQDLPSATITALVQDEVQGTFVGTDRGLGLLKLVDGEFSVQTIALPKIPASQSMTAKVFGLAQGRNGEVWVGSSNGIHRISTGKDGEVVVETLSNSIVPRELTVDRLGALWVHTNTRVHRFTFSSLEITSSNMSTWGSDGIALVEPTCGFYPTEPFGDSFLSTIAADDTGGLWVGTQACGLVHLTFADGVAQYDHTMPSATLAGQSYDFPQVDSLAVASDGSVWLTSKGDLLVGRQSGGHYVYEDLLETYGIRGQDSVSKIFGAPSNNALWVNNLAGLAKLQLEDHGLRSPQYGTADGLPSAEVSSFVVLDGGVLGVGTANGLALVLP